MEISWFLIVNPVSGKGNFFKKWQKIKYYLKINNITYSAVFTQFSKHEKILTEQAIKDGFTTIIAVGGDGTLHHIVNGVMNQQIIQPSKITLGVIPIGTGNDWIKTYLIPKKSKEIIKMLKKRTTILQDIGCIELENKKVTYFFNVAGIGYDGYVVNKLTTLKRFGSIAYLLSGITGLLFYKKSIYKYQTMSLNILF